MPIATSEAAEILNDEFVGVTWYIGLRGGNVELADGGYARVAYADWEETLTNIMTNPTAFAFDQATADWDSADEVAFYTAASGGSPKYTGSLDPPIVVHTGQTRRFEAGDLKIKLIPII
jgi:hypothetical protein